MIKSLSFYVYLRSLINHRNYMVISMQFLILEKPVDEAKLC